MYAQRLALSAQLHTPVINQAVVVERRERQLARISERVVKSHAQSPLAIESYQQRHLGCRLREVGQRRLAFAVAFPEQQSAHLVLLYLLQQCRTQRRSVLRLGREDKQLPYLLVIAQSRHHRVSPHLGLHVVYVKSIV